MTVRLPAGGVELDGDLELPANAGGIVLFAHGSGSSRFSPRNRWVAEQLRRHELGTLLMDLLTPDEALRDERTTEHRFDVDLLGRRLVAALDWLASDDRTATLPVGLFGASTGAAGALVAAAERPDPVKAVVSRGGRPDLAGEALGHVTAPTLLIVGGEDQVVIGLNREAAARLRPPHRLEIVEGASHLFEEPGALETVADLAGAWLVEHLGIRPSDRVTR
jgi:putative phosphoribosyl transferase